MVFRLLGWASNSTGLRENGIWLAGMDSGATSSQQTEYHSHSRAERPCVIPADGIPFSHPITAGQTVHPATRRRPKRCLVVARCTVWPACCRQMHSLTRAPYPPTAFAAHNRRTVFGLVAPQRPHGHGRGTVYGLVACEGPSQGLPTMPRVQIPFLLAGLEPLAMPRIGMPFLSRGRHAPCGDTG